jgi:hypothetical protein
MAVSRNHVSGMILPHQNGMGGRKPLTNILTIRVCIIATNVAQRELLRVTAPHTCFGVVAAPYNWGARIYWHLQNPCRLPDSQPVADIFFTC